MKKALRILLITSMMVFLSMSLSVSVKAQSSQETLYQYTSDLQKNPNDTALREKIIKHVQGMKPAPAIPEEAREHYVMAATFVEKAKDNSGYERAIEQYKAALLAAPWWADAYKKLAISQKAAAHYDDAIASLNFYILTQPADARDAQDEIYKLKALKLSAGEDEKRQREEQQRDAPKNLLRQLKAQYEGATYAMRNCSHARQNVCFEEIGMFPCGCNEAELGGNTWYTGGDGVGRILFPNDGTILIYGDAKEPELRGTPKGPGVENIIWEMSGVYMGGRVEWKPIWVRLEGGIDRILFSPGSESFGAPPRPVDDSLYQPQRRYYYRLFRKQ